MDTLRVSAPKVDPGRKVPCRTGQSNLRRQRAGPMLYQLSYIPAYAPWFGFLDYMDISDDEVKVCLLP